MLNLTQLLIIIAATSILTTFISLVGYWMGRKTKTDNPIYTPKFDPGPTDEPEGDIITDNLYEDEEDKRKSTI